MLGKFKIYLGTDHAGFNSKEYTKKFLLESGLDVEDLGATSLDNNDDYPDFIKPVAKEVSKNKNSFGVIFGGSGQGEAIVANREKGVRAVVYNSNDLEIIKLARVHNNANILSIGARFLNEKETKEAVLLFLETEFPEEERHLRRIEKIDL